MLASAIGLIVGASTRRILHLCCAQSSCWGAGHRRATVRVMAHTPSCASRKQSKRAMPEPIPETPRNIAAALMSTPKPDQWRYLAQRDTDG